MSRGIDYSPKGSNINRDPETGIRYGIIPMHRLAFWVWDDAVENVYIPHCPYCGTELDPKKWDEETRQCSDCEVYIDEGDEFPDEPSERNIDADGVRGMVDSSADAWVFRSPFFTRASFCSPCAPGACYLASPAIDGERAYCPPLEWYGDEECPHPIFRVDDGSLVYCPDCKGKGIVQLFNPDGSPSSSVDICDSCHIPRDE